MLAGNTPLIMFPPVMEAVVSGGPARGADLCPLCVNKR